MAAADAAAAQVALKYDPQQAAIQRAIQSVQGQTQANEAGLNQYGTTGRQNIGNVYDTLGGLLTGNRAQSAADLGQQVNLVGAGYDQAAAAQQAIGQQGRDRVNALANSLNQGAANVQVQSGLESTLANILGQNAQARANSTGNLGTWAAQWDQILGQGQNIGEQSRAKAASDFETELLNLIGSNKVAGLEGENQLQGKLSDILGARQNDLIATYNQLAQQEWENMFRQAQLDQEASAKNASLALQREGMNADNAYRSSQAAKADQLSAKDLMNLFLGQGEARDARAQQDTENMFKRQTLDMQRAELEAKLAGGGGYDDRAQAAYLDYMTNDLSDKSPQAVEQFLKQLEFAGLDTSMFDWQSLAPPPDISNAATSGGPRGPAWSFSPNWKQAAIGSAGMNLPATLAAIFG